MLYIIAHHNEVVSKRSHSYQQVKIIQSLSFNFQISFYLAEFKDTFRYRDYFEIFPYKFYIFISLVLSLTFGSPIVKLSN